MEALAEQLRRLFINRTDQYATQLVTGGYSVIRSPLQPIHVLDHLNGIRTIGTYTTHEGMVKYLCVDIDTMDIALAFSAQEIVWRYLPRASPSVIEFSGSKGYHVWFFFESQPSEHVYSFLYNVFLPKFIEENPAATGKVDLFPRQASVSNGGYGNLVKLPLGKHQKSGAFSELVEVYPRGPKEDDLADTLSRLTPAAVDFSVYAEVARPKSNSVAVEGPARGLFPCLSWCFNEGVGSGMRNHALTSLALFYYGTGVIPEETALELCLEASSRFDPPLSTREVGTVVRSAYSGRVAGFSCKGSPLRSVCPNPNCSGIPPARAGSLADIEEPVFDWCRFEPKGNGTVLIIHPDLRNQPIGRTKEPNAYQANPERRRSGRVYPQPH